MSPACRTSNGAIYPVYRRRGRASGGEVAVRGGGFAALGGFCRRVAPLMVQFPPFTVSEVTPRVVRSLFAGMWRPSRRPPRRTMAGMGVMAQMFCDAGDSGTQFTSAPPPHPGLDGGFCSIRRVLSACRRRVAPLMVQFPPFGGDVTGRHVTHGSSCSASPHSLLLVRSRFGAVWRPRACHRTNVRAGARARGGFACNSVG